MASTKTLLRRGRKAKTSTRAGRQAGVGEGLSLHDADGQVVHSASAAVIESLRYMLARVRVIDGGDLPTRLGITSSVSGEGVTYISRSLALVLANDAGRQVCLVDLNWGTPSTWTTPVETGVAQILGGSASVADALITTGTAGVSFLPAGSASTVDRPYLANHPELDALLLDLTQIFDHVLIDLPAVNLTSEALSLAEKCRTVAVVVSEGTAPDTEIEAALGELGAVTVLGVILNRTTSKVPAIIRRRLPGA